MKFAILYNKQTSTFQDQDPSGLLSPIAGVLKDHGRDCRIMGTTGEALRKSVMQLKADVDVILIAGGDGSLTGAASCLHGSETCLGVLPFGTMNLIARDIGITDYSEETVRRIARGRVQSIDLGEVNGNMFLHSVLIGTFPELAEARETLREGDTLWRWPQYLSAVSRNLLEEDAASYRIKDEKGNHRVTSRSLLISNNKIIDRTGLGLARAHLDRGRLYIYVPQDKTALGTMGVMLRFLSGRWNGRQTLKRYGTRSSSVDTNKQSIRITIDGEIMELKTPLAFQMNHKALKFWIPDTQ